MPYEKSDEQLPKQAQDLPEHAKHIYREAHNNALKQYQDPQKRRDKSEDLEAVAHKVAWGAVKQEYQKSDDGKWHRKAEA